VGRKKEKNPLGPPLKKWEAKMRKNPLGPSASASLSETGLWESGKLK